MYSKEIILYNFYLVYLVQYLNTGTNATRLGISVPQLALLNSMLTAWTLKFNQYMDPGTHNDITTGDINDLFDIDERYTDNVKLQIKSVIGLVLTTADRKYTGIPKKADRRGSIPRPKQKCAVVLTDSSHLSNTFNAFDINNPTKAGKPVDVAKIAVKMLVRAIGVPPHPDPTLEEMTTLLPSGSMKIVKTFLDTQVGYEGFIAVCFLNEKGEEGDWSEIVPFTVI